MKVGDRVRIIKSTDPNLIGRFATIIDFDFRIVLDIDGYSTNIKYMRWHTTKDKLEMLKARIIKVI